MMRASLVGLLLIVSVSLLLAAPPKESPISDLDREHWAFQPLRRPAVPAVRDDKGWMCTPIDAFILDKLVKANVAPAEQANAATLLRRVTFDLTGLPPTPAELAAFESDRSPQAYERVVERLLASPHYGERIGQHWLDLARFAETDGFEHDLVRPQAWKYRDWVIRSLNRDIGYDEFLSMQLAGDELRPGDADAVTATMFCLSGPDMPDINAQDLRRHNLLNEMTATVGAVTMGLQFGCAQCHDHKYDPISQADFFRLRAFFDPAVNVKRDQPVGVLAETKRQPPPSYFYVRGDVTRRGDEINPAFPRIVNVRNEEVVAPATDAKSSQRRAALAKWLTTDDHPLTARVMVNRLWQFHFGRGLATNTSDFGVVGSEPSHPHLLDWLATELVAHDWSLKHVQRLIVTSSVYRTKHAANNEPALFASYPRRRLSAEAIRDAMLVASGQINFESGGPGVMAPLAPEVSATLLPNQWKVSKSPSDHVRRGVYVFARRNLRYPLFDVFDKADSNQSCAQRHVSTTALQSLMMFNSRFALDSAQHLAGRVLQESGGDLDRAVKQVHLLALSRAASEKELAIGCEFLAAQAKNLTEEKREEKSLAKPIPACDKLTAEQAAAVVDYCLAILNTSEFIYTD